MYTRYSYLLNNWKLNSKEAEGWIWILNILTDACENQCLSFSLELEMPNEKR